MPQPRRMRKAMHDLNSVRSVGITVDGQLDEYRFNMFMKVRTREPHSRAAL
jgi:hypothetical protein